MITESQVVKRMVRLVRKRRHKGGWPSRPGLGFLAEQMLTADSPLNVGNSYRQRWIPRGAYKRLRKRIMKKASQPFRRQMRGPKRRRAAGKNEVRPRHG